MMAVKDLPFISLTTHSRVLEYGQAAYSIDLTNKKTAPPVRKQ